MNDLITALDALKWVLLFIAGVAGVALWLDYRLED